MLQYMRITALTRFAGFRRIVLFLSLSLSRCSFRRHLFYTPVTQPFKGMYALSLLCTYTVWLCIYRISGLCKRNQDTFFCIRCIFTYTRGDILENKQKKKKECAKRAESAAFDKISSTPRFMWDFSLSLNHTITFVTCTILEPSFFFPPTGGT